MESAGHNAMIAAGLLLSLAAAGGCPNAEQDGAAPAPQQAAAQPVPAKVDAEPAQPDAPPSPPKWDRPRFVECARQRRDMVQTQIARRGVENAAVLDAMRNVPRHLFTPPDLRDAAHADQPLPIGQGQTISQPYIVALMTEMLEIEPGDTVLEIGTGSGYQVAVLSELTPNVSTIEILRGLQESAAARLKELGYATVRTRQGDGYDGWPEAAPFDAIIVTAAAGHVPPPLTAQLKPDGRMAIPIGPVYGTQELLLVIKDADGGLRTQSVLPVRFVPMTGRAMNAQ